MENTEKNIPSKRLKAAWRTNGVGYSLKAWAREHAPRDLCGVWLKNKAAQKKPRRISGWPEGRAVAPRGGGRRWGRS